MVIGRVLAVVAFVLLLSWPTQAAELFTAPLVPRENNDLIQCQVVNVGQHDRTVRIVIVDGSGNPRVDHAAPLAPPGLVLVSAIAMPNAGGEALTPGYCKFVLDGTEKEFRAAGAVFHIRTGLQP